MDFKEKREKKAFLALAEGSVFYGYSVGAPVDASGEAIFDTSMVGYQEILYDAASAGKIIVMTAPEIGCYGTNSEDAASEKFIAAGLVVRELSEPSNWRSEESLQTHLIRHNIPAIAGVDTRALTILLREKGPQKAFICASGKLSLIDAAKKLSQ